MEVFPEDPNSYIVTPLSVPVVAGGVTASFSVIVNDDNVDEGLYETFRIKLNRIVDTSSNTIPTYAKEDGLLVVIVDDDSGEYQIYITLLLLLKGYSLIEVDCLTILLENKVI